MGRVAGGGWVLVAWERGSEVILEGLSFGACGVARVAQFRRTGWLRVEDGTGGGAACGGASDDWVASGSVVGVVASRVHSVVVASG